MLQKDNNPLQWRDQNTTGRGKFPPRLVNLLKAVNKVCREAKRGTVLILIWLLLCDGDERMWHICWICLKNGLLQLYFGPQTDLLLPQIRSHAAGSLVCQRTSLLVCFSLVYFRSDDLLCPFSCHQTKTCRPEAGSCGAAEPQTKDTIVN